MRRDDGSTIVKIGGSCAFSTDLKYWVHALAACAGRVAIVPGGGPFADAVRAAQAKMGFDDVAAHHMALLAMEQHGCALVGLDNRLSLADTVERLHRSLDENRIPIWLPSRMVAGAAEIPASWDVTSDSLAAWLAGKIGARRLVLLKRVQLSRRPVRADDLASRGIVDKAFAHFLDASGVTAFILGPADHVVAAAAICDDVAAGTPIVSC